MQFEPSRLRRGEVIVGASAIVLLALIFLLPWYGGSASGLGVSRSVDGWHGLPTLRWLMLATVAVAVALTALQGTLRAPALPVSLSVIVTVLGALTSLGLIYRVLIAVPGPSRVLHQKPGSYLGLVTALALTYGGLRSLREEDAPDRARTAAIPTVDLGRRT